MKKLSSSWPSFMLLAILILVNVFVAGLEWKSRIYNNRLSTLSEAGRLLERLHSFFSFEKLFENRLARLFADVKGKSFADAEKIKNLWHKENGLPETAGEFVFFSGSKPLEVSVEAAEDWQFLMERFNCGKIRKYRTAGPERNRLIKLLNGGVGFDRLEAHPGKLQKISIAGRRSYGIWFAADKEAGSLVDGMIAFFHNEVISQKILASALLKSFSGLTQGVGFIDLFAPEDSYVPAGFDQIKIARLVSDFKVKSGLEIIEVDNRKIIVAFKPDGKILCKELKEGSVPVPLWSLALVFFWLPVYLRFVAFNRGKFLFSIHNLVLIVFIISIALPVSAIGVYWQQFFASRLETEKIETARRLEGYLVQLDADYPGIFRTSKRQFSALVDVLNEKPENLQEFVDRSVQLEVDGMFDTCLLINSAGDFIRPYAGAGYPVRRLVFYDLPYRKMVMEELFRQGWVPFDLEADYVLNEPEGKADLHKFITLMPAQGQAAYSSLAKFAGKDLVNMHNDSLDGVSASGKDEVSTMVMSSLVENDDENPVAKIRQNLGGYVELGFDMNQSKNFVDLIKDRNGRALYCMILFSGQYNYAFRYFDKLFKKREAWPEDVNFMVLTGRVFQLSFPAIDLNLKMKWLLDLMQPPRKIHVQEGKINGKDHLICAYVGRSCPGYVFVAHVPMEKIALRLQPLKSMMMTATIIVFIALVFVWFQLRNLILRPSSQIAAGVKAMSLKQHSHMIRIDSGDEWQQLAHTFNTALEGMKELEVAHFVQTCILPAADIKAGRSVFAGRTVPASDVGGDYYDAFAVKEDGLVFIMGDVSGHSISAALVVSMARAAFSAIVDSGVILPEEIFTQMNRLMIEHLRRAKMMTCFAGHVSPDGLLTVCNAGQTYPVLLSADGSSCTVSHCGYPLGVNRKKQFRNLEMELKSPCRLVMFSDGVVEAMNESGEQFGYERFEYLIRKLGCQIERDSFFDAILSELKGFTGDVPWNDDVTIAVLDYLLSEE